MVDYLPSHNGVGPAVRFASRIAPDAQIGPCARPFANRRDSLAGQVSLPASWQNDLSLNQSLAFFPIQAAAQASFESTQSISVSGHPVVLSVAHPGAASQTSSTVVRCSVLCVLTSGVATPP